MFAMDASEVATFFFGETVDFFLVKFAHTDDLGNELNDIGGDARPSSDEEIVDDGNGDNNGNLVKAEASEVFSADEESGEGAG